MPPYTPDGIAAASNASLAALAVIPFLILPFFLLLYLKIYYPGKMGLWFAYKSSHCNPRVKWLYRPLEVRDQMRAQLYDDSKQDLLLSRGESGYRSAQKQDLLPVEEAGVDASTTRADGSRLTEFSSTPTIVSSGPSIRGPRLQEKLPELMAGTSARVPAKETPSFARSDFSEQDAAETATASPEAADKETKPEASATTQYRI